MFKRLLYRIIVGKNYLFLKDINFSLLFINRMFKLVGLNRGFNLPVHFTSFIGNFDKIKYHIDKNTLTSFCASSNCYIQAINGIEFGQNILFASGLKIISANHNINNNDVWDITKPIQIGDNVWLGINTIILPGVQIADSCIVGAGSVLTKSFLNPGDIIAGNPAKVISNKYLKSNAEI
ncbi:acyltransferase [Salegentibacter sp. T436]|uniref:acyltransferase n=1 Tax=Salegentibacter sp. T436 TaxID=1729720 RepID=UPI00094A794E|nr:acyltransferase [Salegentibacter sp. T436]APS37433.1 hypothetical protein AO058_00375 [Salegentibacter sp. T436]